MTVYNKIGWHIGAAPNAAGYGDYIRALDKEKIPGVCMSVGGEGLGDIVSLWDAGSVVQHVAVVRYMPNTPPGSPPVQDVPNYGANQRQEAINWWAWYKPKIGQEVIRHKDKIVLKMGNELDKNKAEWLAGWSLELYNVAQNDSDGPFRIGSFSFAAGEPEPSHWRGPTMLEYLRLCADDPIGAAVILHEYSYQDVLNTGDFNHIGRFLELFRACDENGIKRPWVYLHEGGWRQEWLPGETEAMSQIPWWAELYAKYKEVKGVGLWTLQTAGNYGNPHISQLAQPLIEPLKQYSLTAKFPDPPEEPEEPMIVWSNATRHHVKNLNIVAAKIACFQEEQILGVDGKTYNYDKYLGFVGEDGQLKPGTDVISFVEYTEETTPGGSLPPQQYARVVYVAPSTATEVRKQEIALEAIQDGRTFTQSHDDAGYAPGFLSNTAVLFDIPEANKQEFIDWYAGRYPNTTVEFRDPKASSPLDGLQLGQLFNVPYVQTSPFNDPRDYSSIGGPKDAKHEGVDFDVIGTNPDSKEPVLCVYDGIVERSLDSTGGYGKYVRVQHERNGSIFYTRYCHLDTRVVSVGQTIAKGSAVGEIGASGFVSGEHVHFNLEVPGFGMSGYVVADVVDPTPYLPPPLTDTGGKYTGPPVTTFVSGVDQPASDWYWSTGKAVFEVSGLSPKFHTGGNNHTWWDSFKNPVFNLVRVLLDPNFAGDAQAIFNETTNNVAQFYARGARDFELLNEPNIEGMGVRWNNGREFGAVFRALCKAYKDAYPEIRLWFPGMSPGFGAQHTFIGDAAAVGAFDYIYGMCEHVYTGIVDNAQAASDQMLAEVKDFQKRWALTRPLCLTEFAVNRPASGVYKATVYQKLYAALANIPGIQAAYSFTSTWYPSPDENQEGWLENGIHNQF